jgi:hypothetical protein
MKRAGGVVALGVGLVIAAALLLRPGSTTPDALIGAADVNRARIVSRAARRVRSAGQTYLSRSTGSSRASERQSRSVRQR